MKSEMEIMTYNHQDDPTSSTGRIERAVSRALHIFGLLDIRRNSEQAAADARRAWKTVERLEQRELRARAAAYNASKMDVKETE